MSGFRLFDLNPPQQEAVRQTEGPVLILAGAGTGKTHVITARIAFMVYQGIPPERILAVTFTNKAANEMRERVACIIDSGKAKAVTIGTFHSLCVRILRQSIERLGYKRNFTIYSESEQTSLLKKIITRTAAKDEKLDPAVVKACISRAKNDGVSAPPDSDDTLLAEVFRRYADDLKKLNAVDFDDLLLLAVQVLKRFPEERDIWRERFRYFMVDEFQDTNKLQLDLVGLLAGDPPNVCVVGDDDQSIYSWRGAEVSNILDFERHFPDPKVVKLEQNYRSTNAILRTANSLIRNNPRRRPKNLWSEHGDGESIRIIPLPDDREEAEFVVSEIQRLKSTESLPWEAFAVLYRMNAQSRLLEENLRSREIPYRLVGGKSFFDRREIKDLIAYAHVVRNPDDDISLLRVVNNPPRGISPKTTELALHESIQRRTSLIAVLRDEGFLSQLSTRASAAIRHFIGKIADFEARISEPLVNYADILQALLEETGYLEGLTRSCKTAEEAESRAANIRSVLDDLRVFQGRSSRGLAGFLDNLALDDSKEDDDKEKGGGVTLITLHAAKGLEFPHVFLIGLEEGLIPHERSKMEGNLDEERRLFYVGITRAMRTLTLTRSLTRMRYGDKIACRPSSFLDELDETHVLHLDADEIRNAPASEEDVKSALAAFRKRMREAG